MTTLHLSHKKIEKHGLKKYVKVVSKFKKKHYQMKILLVKCIKIFLIHIFLIFKIFK